MKGYFCVLVLLLGIFSTSSQGQDLCSAKRCTGKGQICVVNNHNQAVCQCRESCPRPGHQERVCGSDGITYKSRCILDRTSCKLGTDITVDSNRCKGNLKLSAAHQLKQTLVSGRRGEIHCEFEGKAAQVLWKKVGMLHHLPYGRVLSSNSKTLRFRRVHAEDAGTYKCRAYSGSSIVEATVVVAITDPSEVDSNVASPHVCHLEKLIGTGTNFSTRWYFDSKNGMCQPFPYSGVGGNENNFDSKILCLRKCSHAAGDICSLHKKPGLCMAYFPRWYYDTNKGKCEPFIYGGCMANANNFKTKDKCEETCSASRICSLTPETGPCKAYMPRYFYNQTSGQCDKFIYGGCQGNSNNFPTFEICQEKCQTVSNRTPKDKQEKPGRCPWGIPGIPIFCIMSKDTCQSDDECDDDKKCCQSGCGLSCMMPLTTNKPGKCPRVPQGDKDCDRKGDMCDRDTDCPGNRKCCFNGCQRDCRVPEAPKRIKPGVCPAMNAINPNLCKITKDECKMDDDCFGHLKCCFNGCFSECMKRPQPRPKPGMCPITDYIPPENCSDTEDKCMDDTQCQGRDKCCATGCLKECVTPPAVKKPGMCPILDYINPEDCEVTEDECEEDSDCDGRDKCCDTGCIKECITPPIEVKPGECPLVNFISPELCTATEDECEYDNDCKGRDKCCATGCIQECVTPPKGRPEINSTFVHVVGRCPKPWKGRDGVCDRRGDMCHDDDNCNETTKCCFNGCQKDCIEPIPVYKIGSCPKPWKGQDGICDRRGDMCSVDIDCEDSEKCCFNGCQRDCVKPHTRDLSERPGQCPSPWKEQPCDRRGDMCDTDDDCGDSAGNKCCHNGCQKDCAKPVNLTKCQEETIKALDKLVLDPPLLGVFVPRCKPDGEYEVQQCHELHCWCVDKVGNKIPGTTVWGSAVCLPQDKQGKCPKPWKGQNGICDYRGDMCLQDSDCSGDDRCCFNGCQNDCVPPVGIKLCKKHKKANGASDNEPPLIGAFGPSCKVNGDYEEIQCHGSTGFCWCVDKFGNELEGTRTRGELNCSHPELNAGNGKNGTCPKQWKGLTGFCDKMGDECGMDYHCAENEKCCFSGCQHMCVNTTEAHKKAQTKPGQCPKPWLGQEGLCDRRGDMCSKDVDCQGGQLCCFNGCQLDCVNPGLSTCQKRFEESFLFPPLGRFVPSCKDDGRFQERQCHPSTGHCWCVDSYGTELLGTRTRGRPNCTAPDPCLSTTCPYYGQCVRSADRKSVECKCNIACTFIYDPVCGTDGKTYANECVMRSTACVQKKNIAVDYKGECEEVDPCASVKCGFYSECVIMNGSATCVCPGSGSRPSCSSEKDPVCGSDGVIYDNICHLKNASCVQQMMITPSLLGKCEDPCSGITCGHPLMECIGSEEGKPVCECPLIDCDVDNDPVCATDGQTYSTTCMMDSQSCQAGKIVSVEYKGECNKSLETAAAAVEDSCSKINCSNPFATCEVVNGTATCVCPVINTLEYFPVCGSDGVTYPNVGALNIASCNSGGAVKKVENGECSKLFDPCAISFCSHKRHRCELQNGTAVCICNTACTLEYAPVCASNNETYPNKCTMEVAACESGERLRVVKGGRCEGMTRNKPDICPSPWKGLDGICDRRGDTCQSNADCDQQGGGKCCFNGCQKDCVQFGKLKCPQKCHPNGRCVELVFGGRRCVCNPGFVGNGIECSADPCSVKKCDHYARCNNVNGVGKCVCPEVCPKIFAPVCGSDGNVYDNDCLMRVASCKQQKKITFASKETCKPDPCKKSKCSHPQHTCMETSIGAVCVCPPTPCTLEFVPVCGSDGKTYPNSCVMRVTACENSQNITLASQGECKTNDTNPCDVPSLCTHPYHQCQLVGTKAVCMCPMIIPANLAPVCGSDGQTYPNAKALESMSCLANRIVDVQYEGECIVPTDPCDISLCSHSRHQCQVVDGMATCVCNEICPLILMPVCGSDGQTYPNNCSLEVEACVTGKELTVVAMGECDQCANMVCPDPRKYCRVVNGSASCVCNEICTSDWRPVCGSDGKTYPNECSLEVEACKTGKKLRKVHSGECAEKLTCPRIDPTPVCARPSKPNCLTGGPKCGGGKACCLDHDCTHKCVDPALPDGSRPGECPMLNPIPGCAAVNGCVSDGICNLGERCCLQSNCTKKCVKAVVPPPPPRPKPTPAVKLTCPLIDPMPGCARPSKPNCFTGGPKCGGGKACCLDHDCTHKCVDPALPDGSRPGECPVLNPIPGCAAVNGCVSDGICNLGERCCLQSDCTKKCVKAVVPRTRPMRPHGVFILEKKHSTGKPKKGNCNPPCHRYGSCVKVNGKYTCSCARACPRIYSPVCGTDGVTYSTECMRMYLVCKKGTDVRFKHSGKCREEKHEDQCPVLNPTPMCASVTGCSNHSECQEGEKCCLGRDCVRTCVAKAKPGQCPVIKRLPCPLILKPDECTTDWDCAGDLKCCSDGCTKECSSGFLSEKRASENPCKFSMCRYPRPVCKAVGKKATCQCRKKCPRHYDPVCASNGETYNNMCLLELTACLLEDTGMPAGKLTYLANGNCTVAQICSLPPETGRCRASMKRFFFNATSRKCEEFRFGGCEGNANRFDSEEECQDYCGSLNVCDLKPCPDPYARCSISVSGERQCSCPQICTADYNPVCGTDGQTYSNECQMRVAACSHGMMIKIKSRGKCKNNPGFCPSVDPRVCWDGHEDECFDDASCDADEKCCHDGCKKNCIKPLSVPRRGPPRPALPRMVPHRLHKVPPAKDPCKKCKFPKTFCSRDKNGTAECLCPQFCTREFAPVCGTDGRNYSNKCQLEVEACKPENIRTLKVKHLGPCVCDLPPVGGPCFGYMPRYFFNATKKRCERFIYGGCRGNGNNFETVQSCEDKCISPCKNYKCPYPRTRCELEEGLPVCKCPVICTADYRPVCGTDGKTYANMCGLEAAACHTKHFKLGLKHLGDCLSVNPCEGFVCSHQGESCVVKRGKAACVCNKVCTREYEPYCASDGNTYSNNCTLQLAACESGESLTIVHPGECGEHSDDPCLSVKCPFHGVCQISQAGDPVCQCVTECPDIYDPVCGSDGKNYSSECVLKSQACQAKTAVRVVGSPKKCVSRRLKCNSCPARSHVLKHFCESDFVIEGTLEEIRSTEDEDHSSVLMVKVTTMFKGPESIQNKIIKIKFGENLHRCSCKELRMKKAVIIAGSTTDKGEHFLDKSSSFVRHAGRRLIQKVQQHTKHDKCNKNKKQD